MKAFFSILLLLQTILVAGQTFKKEEISAWKKQSGQITIIRDNWGVPHIFGNTDADVVFGLLYSQCEDDFERVEANYITSIGRLAEVEGEKAIYEDLRARMFLDSTQAISIYKSAPIWLKKLLNAFADGTNFYLYSHPNIHPKLLKRFQPWMPLMFSEGSIGGNISNVPIEPIKGFYTNQNVSFQENNFDKNETEPVGSNGFAISPFKSKSKNALLLINPHTSFYFRSEVHLISKEGLNTYGAVTWGQFFVYQGFNEKCGWMHTTSGADSMDEYLETIEQKNGKYFYKYGKKMLPVQAKKVVVFYKNGNEILSKNFTIYRTHHGPIVGTQGEKWIALKMMNTPFNALAQSFLRTKATDYSSFKKVMNLNGNASNNTVFADSKGNIAYWHGNFMPKRDKNFDWSQPVDGSNPATEWKGFHSVDELVQVHNPATGWIQNSNSTPFTVSGESSPKKNNYPNYMAPDAENFRGMNGARVLGSYKIFTLDTLIAAANNPYLAGFEELIPALISDFQKNKNSSKDLAEAIDSLQAWNKCYGANSIPTTLAVFWGEKIMKISRTRFPANQKIDYIRLTKYAIAETSPEEKINALKETLSELTNDFGTWKTAWGAVNRFQRLTGKIQETYDDKQPSIPVAFTSSAWGSLAAFGAKTYPETKRRYGNVGNSFVAVVEFGKKVKARSVVTGGQNSNPNSLHFNDQSALYCEGKFKKIWFYPNDIRKHAEKIYHPK